MINILYLLKILKTEKLSELVANIDAPLLDINLALFDAEDAGEVEVNREKDKIKALKEAEPSRNEELANKLLRTIQHYAKKEINITLGRLTGWCKNQAIDHNYLYHDYICTVQYLIDTEQITEDIVTMPKKGKRPLHKFVFLGLPENKDKNEEWNAREINKWVKHWEESGVK